MSVLFSELKSKKKKEKEKKKSVFEYYGQFMEKCLEYWSISKGKSSVWQMYNNIHRLKGLRKASCSYFNKSTASIIQVSILKLSAAIQERWFSKLQSAII